MYTLQKLHHFLHTSYKTTTLETGVGVIKAFHGLEFCHYQWLLLKLKVHYQESNTYCVSVVIKLKKKGALKGQVHEISLL